LTVDDRTTAGGIGYGGDGVGFGTALIAVFLAGVVTGALTASLSVYETLGKTTTLLMATFASILIGAVAIKVILSFMDATVSLTVAVVTVILGSLVPLLVNAASTPSRLHAETHAAHTTPVVLPFVSFGYNALSGLLWIAVLFGQAMIIQNHATKD
jgi:hypothetical protein